MSPEVAEVERALLALSEHDRAAVIHTGLLSLDGGLDPIEEADVDLAWRHEIGSRLDEVLAGRAELGSFEETYARFVAGHPAPAE